MFGNQNNNSYENKGVNTKIKSFYGDLSYLQVAYWNDKISISINPLKSVDQNGLRQYDYQRKLNTAIVAEKSLALAANIKETMLPAWLSFHKGEKVELPITASVITSTKGTMVSVELIDADGKLAFYVRISMKDPNTGEYTEANSLTYRFMNTESQVKEGKDTKIVVTPDEFMIFYNKLKDISDIFGTTAHAAKMDDNKKDSGFQNTFQGNNNTPSNNYSAPMSSFGGDEDFPFE